MSVLTCMDYVGQWEQRVHEIETMVRETWPDIVKRAISAERSPAESRTRLLMNTQNLMEYAKKRAAIEAFLAVKPEVGTGVERCRSREVRRWTLMP